MENLPERGQQLMRHRDFAQFMSPTLTRCMWHSRMLHDSISRYHPLLWKKTFFLSPDCRMERFRVLAVVYRLALHVAYHTPGMARAITIDWWDGEMHANSTNYSSVPFFALCHNISQLKLNGLIDGRLLSRASFDLLIFCQGSILAVIFCRSRLFYTCSRWVVKGCRTVT